MDAVLCVADVILVRESSFWTKLDVVVASAVEPSAVSLLLFCAGCVSVLEFSQIEFVVVFKLEFSVAFVVLLLKLLASAAVGTPSSVSEFSAEANAEVVVFSVVGGAVGDSVGSVAACVESAPVRAEKSVVEEGVDDSEESA